jgi:prepilin-type N-terminal cleavage/methylation domain-containing protein
MVMEHHPRVAQAGFTMVEIMVAILILLVGVLGTVKMIDVAFAKGTTSRTREAATNLAREIVEVSRSVDYDALVTTTLPATLQALPGLADSAQATPGWQLDRRGIRMSVTVEACIVDDPQDGFASGNTGPGYCSGLGSGSTDNNGDDYRKLDITIAWRGGQQVKLIANVVNPSGGLGPRIVDWSPKSDLEKITLAATTSLRFDVTTTATARTLRWDADDGQPRRELTNVSGSSAWWFTWELGTVGDYSCATPATWLLDSQAYSVSFQAYDGLGVPGDYRTQVVALDRSDPFPVCDVAGGRNPQHGGVIDLQWRPSPETDVVSYSVWREKNGTEEQDRLVCDAVTKPECADTVPIANGSAATYYVRARQGNARGVIDGSPVGLSLPDAVPNEAPASPGSVELSYDPDAVPTVSWSPSADSVVFYRIYRDGNLIKDRYASTIDGAADRFVDNSAAGETNHTYYVSAVDDQFAESEIVPAVIAPAAP